MLINFILSSQEELSDLAAFPDLPSHQLPAAAHCWLVAKLSILSIKALSVNLVDLPFELSLINWKLSESHRHTLVLCFNVLTQFKISFHFIYFTYRKNTYKEN